MQVDIQNEYAHLTVVNWPSDADEDARAMLLAEAMGADLTTMRLMARHAPPAIYGWLPRAKAEEAVSHIKRRGGDVFSTTLADLRKLGPTLKIKRMRLACGALALDLWRGEPVRLEPGAIFALIRARLREKGATNRQGSSQIEHVTRRIMNSHISQGSAIGDVSMSSGVSRLGDLTPVKASTRLSERLDIHDRKGHVYQINADKFGFRILGELRDHTNAKNMDKLFMLMTSLAPGAITDQYFSLWKPPASYHRLRLSGRRAKHEDPAFAFYSRWSATLYRHVQGA